MALDSAIDEFFHLSKDIHSFLVFGSIGYNGEIKSTFLNWYTSFSIFQRKIKSLQQRMIMLVSRFKQSQILLSNEWDESTFPFFWSNKIPRFSWPIENFCHRFS